MINSLRFLHIISFVCWMAGLFYLPRLYVYHSMYIDKKSNTSMLEIMERKLLRGIIWPSFIGTLISGSILSHIKYSEIGKPMWLWVKIIFALSLFGYQLYLGRIRLNFLNRTNIKNHVFYRYLNEYPTIILLIVIGMAVFRPNLF